MSVVTSPSSDAYLPGGWRGWGRVEQRAAAATSATFDAQHTRFYACMQRDVARRETVAVVGATARLRRLRASYV